MGKYVLVRKGAEADIYLTNWHNKKAISKIRTQKPYRNLQLDTRIRKIRTIHEAELISTVKKFEIRSPFLYYVDISKSEIIMEYIDGINAKDILSPRLCYEMGKITGILHSNNIIHGDLTTSNFLIGDAIYLIDFGLSFYSEKIEDYATDIRVIKEVYSSVHYSIYEEAFLNFVKGYSSILDLSKSNKVLSKVVEIEKRGRYARIQ